MYEFASACSARAFHTILKLKVVYFLSDYSIRLRISVAKPASIIILFRQYRIIQAHGLLELCVVAFILFKILVVAFPTGNIAVEYTGVGAVYLAVAVKVCRR